MKTLTLFTILSLLLSSCKKNDTNSGNSNNGASNQWFFKCNVDSTSINIGSSNYQLPTGYFSGGGGADGTGITITVSSGCNTSPKNPCFTFALGLQYLAIGSYTITNNYTFSVSPLYSLVLDLQTDPYQTNYLATPSSPTAISDFPILKINITHVGKVGENISGNFSGTIRKQNTASADTTIHLANIEGSFNVYRQN